MGTRKIKIKTRMAKEDNAYWIRQQYVTKDNRLVSATIKMINGEPTEERITTISTPLKKK